MDPETREVVHYRIRRMYSCLPRLNTQTKKIRLNFSPDGSLTWRGYREALAAILAMRAAAMYLPDPVYVEEVDAEISCFRLQARQFRKTDL